MSDPCTTPVRAGSSVGAMTQHTTVTATLDAFGIVVSDLAASLAFYRALGLPVPEGAETGPHAEVVLAGGVRLMFDTEDVARSLHPDWTPPVSDGRIGLACSLPTPADVDAKHTELIAAGHRSALAPFDAPWGQRYATVLDPDGNSVDLYAALGD